MNLSIDQQVTQLMQKTAFGDARTAQTMARELRALLAQDRPLQIYLGVDPTAPDLHLGHAVPLQNLATFQAWGHTCILLIGDFTARIGDPSDKDKTRPQLTLEQIQANVKTYREQVFRLLDPERTQIRYNSEWHDELSFEDMIKLAGRFTVAQFLTRDNFAKRFAQGDPIYLHEFSYALMQGYDALALGADVQLGGTDQTFNIFAGRRLQEAQGQPPQVMLTNPMLPGIDGRRKMSKSLNNAIPIMADPPDMYGKLMSLPDETMPIYFKLLTDFSSTEIDQMFAEMAQGQRHPRDVKMCLARQITARMWSRPAAVEAETHFTTVFRQRKRPADMPQHRLDTPITLIDLLVALNLAQSKSAARRLIQQGGVRLDETRVADIALSLQPAPTPRTLQVGKRHFVALI